MEQDIYTRMGKELRALFKNLQAKNRERVRRELEAIQKLAGQIGSPIKQEADRLRQDIEKYLEKPNDPKLAQIVKQHALHLEQETREL